MPIFEFICIDCGEPFEDLVLSSRKVGEVTCPTCHGQNITKKISTFAYNYPTRSSYSFSSNASSSCSTGSA